MHKIQTPKSRKKTKSPACESCKFLLTSGESGVCCRYPPALINAMQSGYPPVNLTLWCGEWKAKA
jgi:hypothetical protein